MYAEGGVSSCQSSMSEDQYQVRRREEGICPGALGCSQSVSRETRVSHEN